MIEAVILAAGMGTRLGRPFPKPLTPLSDGRTIMEQQIDNLRQAFGADVRITTVVGFKLDLILEAFPDVRPTRLHINQKPTHKVQICFRSA